MLHIVWITLIGSVFEMVNSDLYTSLVSLENLPQTLKRTIDNLDNYINLQEKKLQALNRYIIRFKSEHDLAMRNVQNYLENPIKIFILIKQLTSDLENLKIIIKTRTESITKSDNGVYPRQEDLSGAVSAIARLQKTYKLTVKDLAAGNLSNTSFRPPMTAGDCYVVGQILLRDDIDIVKASQWFIESLLKYNTEEKIYYFTDVHIIEHISKAYHIIGDKKTALQWIQKLVNLHPHHLKAKKKIDYFETMIAHDEAKKVDGRKRKWNHFKQQEQVIETYEAMCRGDLVIPVKTSSRLSCRYLTGRNAYLKLAPLKIEEMYLDPDVILFHEIVSENEMELIKQMARPRLNRSEARDPDTGKAYYVEQRISKLTWILDKESDTVARISRRVSDMTNLNMARSEPLQVVNYGIGGQFEPHCDFPPDVRFIKTGGDRIATVMFYMSEVAKGGATVFPELGVSVSPVKGNAIYWNNLNGAGELDAATLHAGCPALLGSKWVSNKWIHEYGQDNLQICRHDYEMKRRIPRPVTKTSRDQELFEKYQTNYKAAKQIKHRHRNEK